MTENAATRRFCAQCGAALPLSCPACGFENEPTARFCGGCGKPIGEAAASAQVTALPIARTDAERRQLTVMFCDLVGSTAMSETYEGSHWRYWPHLLWRLDHHPDWRPFLDTYRTMCLAPQPEFRRLLEQVRDLSVAP
jgi:hypothetical protein